MITFRGKEKSSWYASPFLREFSPCHSLIFMGLGTSDTGWFREIQGDSNLQSPKIFFSLTVKSWRLPFPSRSLISYTKVKTNMTQKKNMKLVKELFSSLRGVGSSQGSANNLVVLSSRQTKAAIYSKQRFFTDESSSFKEKPKRW